MSVFWVCTFRRRRTSSGIGEIIALVHNTAHHNEQYGNLETYLRLKGLVPPSSQPLAANRRMPNARETAAFTTTGGV